jgi:hypothetical protein
VVTRQIDDGIFYELGIESLDRDLAKMRALHQKMMAMARPARRRAA